MVWGWGGVPTKWRDQKSTISTYILKLLKIQQGRLIMLPKHPLVATATAPAAACHTRHHHNHGCSVASSLSSSLSSLPSPPSPPPFSVIYLVVLLFCPLHFLNQGWPSRPPHPPSSSLSSLSCCRCLRRCHLPPPLLCVICLIVVCRYGASLGGPKPLKRNILRVF